MSSRSSGLKKRARVDPIPTIVEWQKETAILSKLVYLSFGNDFGRTYFGKITPWIRKQMAVGINPT